MNECVESYLHRLSEQNTRNGEESLRSEKSSLEPVLQKQTTFRVNSSTCIHLRTNIVFEQMHLDRIERGTK